MKKITILIVVLFNANLTLKVTAQNTTFNNVSIGTDIPAGGILMKMNFPNLTGGWARGLQITNETGAEKYIEFAAFGGSTAGVSTFKNAYIGKDWNVQFMTFLANGNVGIGVTEPSTKLEVQKSLNENSNEVIASITRTRTPNGGSSIVRFGYHNTCDFEVNSGYSNTGHRFGSYFDLNIVNNSTGGLHGGVNFVTNGTIKMGINVNGNVGIGTASTGTHKLAVEGSIGAREVRVQATGWSDFVFDKKYSLPTLTEVEKHIKEKGHLKDIPSEAEVLKNGISLGEMDSKLLQKIEELTLYIIEMKKENEEMKKNISELKQQITTKK